MKKKRRNWIVWTIVTMVLLGIGGSIYYFFLYDRIDKEKQTNQATTVYTVKEVEHEETVEVSGNIEPIEEKNLSFRTSGIVTGIYVKEGDYVRKGTLLAELDNSEKLYDLAQVNYQIKQKELEGAKREIELLNMEKKLREQALDDLKIHSPISGIVSSVSIEKGDFVAANHEVIRVIDISSMKADVEVDEIDAPEVKVGQMVVFHFDAFPEIEVKGKVSKLPIEGTVTNEGIAVLNTEIVIDKSPREIHPGFSFTAEIVVKPSEKILVVNKDAVLERNGKKLVFPANVPVAENVPLSGQSSGQNANRQSSGQINSQSANRGNNTGRRVFPRPVTVKTESYSDEEVRIISGVSKGTKLLSVSQLLLKMRNGNTNTNTNSSATNPLSIFGFPTRRSPGTRRPAPQERE